MRVHLTSASGERSGLAISALHKVQQCAQLDRIRTHTLTDDPDVADIILFVETDQGIGPFGTQLRRHPLVRRMPDKCFAYNSSDNPVAHLPGLYASIEKRRYNPKRVRSTHYLSTHITIPEPKTKPMADRALLYSFVGAAQNAKVRQDLMLLRHARGKCVDTSAEVATVWDDPLRRAVFVDDYATTLAETKFALCPRGCGAGSMRLFEAMRVGCVPVILSDEWVQPSGPNWADFSVVVPEHEVLGLPRLLEELEPTAEAKSVIARQVWADWFSDEVTFHRLIEWCVELLHGRAVSERRDVARWVALTERLWPDNAATTVRWLKALARTELNRRIRHQASTARSPR
jgi:Exostosin family